MIVIEDNVMVEALAGPWTHSFSVAFSNDFDYTHYRFVSISGRITIGGAAYASKDRYYYTSSGGITLTGTANCEKQSYDNCGIRCRDRCYSMRYYYPGLSISPLCKPKEGAYLPAITACLQRL
jgi:hypothetical protein